MQDTALVIGNGPSVDQLDPAWLDHCYSFGCNHIYRKFEEWGRETDAVVITDHNRLREIGQRYATFRGDLFVGDERYAFPPKRRIKGLVGRDFTPLRQLTKETYPTNALTDRIRWSKYLYATIFDKWRMTFDLDAGLNFGRSVVMSCIQLAAIAGFKRILLIGVDARYGHGHDYFRGMKADVAYVNNRFIQNPRLAMEPMLVIAQVLLDDLDVELLDGTPGGALRFIEKVDLEEALGGV